MYASQLGWLHVRPKGQTGDAKTRLALLADAGREPLLPELGEVEYLARYWHELGRVEQCGMGPSTLSNQEILAWRVGRGVSLSPWEYMTLRHMSSAYIHHLIEGEKPEAPAPYGKTRDNVDRERVDKQIRSAFKALMQADKK